MMLLEVNSCQWIKDNIFFFVHFHIFQIFYKAFLSSQKESFKAVMGPSYTWWNALYYRGNF